jgi:hypothetical protein
MEIEESQRSYFSIPGITPLLGITVGELIDEAAQKFGHKDALVVPFQRIRRSFIQLKEEVSVQ